MSLGLLRKHFPFTPNLPGGLAAILAVSLTASVVPAWGQESRSSITIGDSTVTLIGGGNQSISAVGTSARITIDNRRIVVEPRQVSVDGDPIEIEPFTEAIIDASGWGFTITTDDSVIFAIGEIDGLQEAAAAGDAAAQNDLGVRYSRGDGVAQDPVRAAELYRAAANQGLAVAQSNYGHRLWTGLGVDQDRTEAVTWFRRAAENGNVIAMVALAEALFEGDGTNRDTGQALRWFEQAADADNGDAMNYIGHMYATGIGVDQDAATAVTWFQRAADIDHAMGTRNLGLHYLNGDGVDQDREKARDLFETALALGHEPARQDLAGLDVDDSDPAETQLYWYAADGQSMGPIPLGDLRRMFGDGRVTAETLVWTEGMPDWAPAGQAAGLR